jgi:predicted phage terminase large subunit-like protein
MTARQQAAAELLKRRRARENLVDFARYTKDGYIPAAHHHLICDALERVEAGKCKRLMVCMPPRHGKSELTSRRFPAWFLGRNPHRSIIAASYNSELAGDFGRDVRNISREQEFKNLFEMRLAEDSTAAGRWHTNGGGGYVAAGVGTAITGRGANVLLIDDPFKDRESADSERMRDRTYNWYLSTAYTRLEGGLSENDEDDLWNDWRDAEKEGDAFEGAIVLINTRWHEDDLSGRLLKDMEDGADQWEVLDLPAINDEGEALWPAKYPIETLQNIKKALTTKGGSREWESLYQQNPTVDEGTFFKREWFKRYRLGEQPKTNNYQSGDYAVTDNGGDYTEFGVFGMCGEGHLWVRDWWYGQTSADVWIEKQLDQYEKFNCYASFGETGVIRRAVEPLLEMISAKKRIYLRQEWITRGGNKSAMARSFQGMAASGMIHIPRCDWGDRLVDQLCKFPAGAHDDAVDPCALIAMAINDAHPAILAEVEETQAPRDAYGWDDEDDGDTWRTA